jgi:mutator protein MutT
MKKYLYKVGIYLIKLYWFVFRPNGYGVKCIIEKTDGKILFIKNTYGKGNWNFPGGKIEKGESSETAIKREVLEEVGIGLDSVRKIGSFISTLEYKKDHIEVFHACIQGDVGKVQESEIQEYVWADKYLPPQPLSFIARESLSLL